MSVHVDSEHRLVQYADDLTLQDLVDFVSSMHGASGKQKISVSIEDRGVAPELSSCLVLKAKVYK